LQSSLKEAKLATATLPSLINVGAEVDLRFGFEGDGTLSGIVPLAIFHFDTDGDGQEIWFQASLSEVRNLITGLEKIANHMEIAARMAEGLAREK
jgi:hypothetical protein